MLIFSYFWPTVSKQEEEEEEGGGEERKLSFYLPMMYPLRLVSSNWFWAISKGLKSL